MLKEQLYYLKKCLQYKQKQKKSDSKFKEPIKNQYILHHAKNLKSYMQFFEFLKIIEFEFKIFFF